MNSRVEKFVLSYVKDYGTKCVVLLSDGKELEISLKGKEQPCRKKQIFKRK